MIAYLTAGLLCGVVTGFLTRPMTKEKLDAFYEDLKRPVVGDEVIAGDTM